MRRAVGYNDMKNDENGYLGLPLPNLPGHYVPLSLGGTRQKQHTLKYHNGYAIVEDVQQHTADHEHKRSDVGPVPPFALHDVKVQVATAAPQRAVPNEASTSGRPVGVPNWLAYDRKVLGFRAYFREEVPNSPLESWRIRKVLIRYFLENDQVEITEMREENSGLPQGTLLRRHCAVKQDGTALRWQDFRVGSEVVLYRRPYILVSADAFTRTFYAEHEKEQPPDEVFPEGPYDQRQKALEASRARPPARPPTRGAPTSGPRDFSKLDLDQDCHAPSPRGPSAVFMVTPLPPAPEVEQRDSSVLRFLCAWDNTAVTFGEVLAFSLHYYVSDGTVEVREVQRRNSGRDPFPLLLSRCRLPKTVPPVFGRPLSPRSLRLLDLDYYSWRDLTLGTTVNVYNRPLLLYDCDEPTRAWLQKHFPGITEKQLRRIEVDFDPTGPKRPPLSIPPHSGIGSEEDSLQNVLHLVPKPPPKPYGDYLENWSKVLRFDAAMAPLRPGRPLAGPHDKERRFIVSFHLLDRTLAIWEPKRDNSGMEHGTFLERTRVRNPATGQTYMETDMQVGAVLEVFGRGFQLLDADTYTLRYMEREAAQFPWADYDKVLSKLSAWLALYPDQLPDRLRAELLAADRDGSGYLSKYKLHDALSSLGSDLSPHEVLTLVRQLGADRQGLLAQQLLVALGLAPPPEPEPERPPVYQHKALGPPQPPPPPFPATGLQQPQRSAQYSQQEQQAEEQQRRVAWAPHPDGPLALTRGDRAQQPYQGIGPTPGYPRIDVPASSQQVHKAPSSSSSSFREQPNVSLAAWMDDRRQRDAPERASSSSSDKDSSAPSQRPAGHPVSLWMTTNMSYGGIGHAASFRKR